MSHTVLHPGNFKGTQFLPELNTIPIIWFQNFELTCQKKKTFQNSPRGVIENMFVPEVFQLAKCLFQSFNVNTYNIVRSGRADFNIFNEGHEDDYS